MIHTLGVAQLLLAVCDQVEYTWGKGVRSQEIGEFTQLSWKPLYKDNNCNLRTPKVSIKKLFTEQTLSTKYSKDVKVLMIELSADANTDV